MITIEVKNLLISYFVRYVVSPVLWIRISFNADPDPAFHLIADLDLGSQNNADPDPDSSQTLPTLKLNFHMKNIPYFT